MKTSTFMSFTCIVVPFGCAGIGLAILMAPPPHTQATQTAYALSNWAKDCDPNDLHYGQTGDGQGQRAFIVTCTAKGR